MLIVFQTMSITRRWLAYIYMYVHCKEIRRSQLYVYRSVARAGAYALSATGPASGDIDGSVRMVSCTLQHESHATESCQYDFFKILQPVLVKQNWGGGGGGGAGGVTIFYKGGPWLRAWE